MRETYKGLVIKTARSTGGKAGKGLNKTSTVQVIEPHEGYHLMHKHFRYVVNDRQSLAAAWLKARAFVDAHLTQRGTDLLKAQAFCPPSSIIPKANRLHRAAHASR